MNPLALPSLPAYEGLHPLVVHFALAVPMLVPVFVGLALVWKSQWRAMLFGAMVVCVVGTGFAIFAVDTGEATEQFARVVPGTGEALHRHEELAELARNLFIGVSIALVIANVVAWKWHEKLKTGARLGLLLSMLAIWVLPALVLANAAHAGGVLVHVFGVKAPIVTAAEMAELQLQGEEDRGRDR